MLQEIVDTRIRYRNVAKSNQNRAWLEPINIKKAPKNHREKKEKLDKDMNNDKCDPAVLGSHSNTG